MFDDALEQQWKSMIHAGYSEEQINLAKQRKRDKENVRIYEYMVQQHAWEFDVSCDRVAVHLKLARALDAVCRRCDAIEILKEATEEDHLFDSRLLMALAKLLFRDDQKELSLHYCQCVTTAYLQKQKGKMFELEEHISVEDALKAYYLAGWIQIHDDNHTKAYQIWGEGHHVIPSCPVLKKQNRKRECWDQDPAQLQHWLKQVTQNSSELVFNLSHTFLLQFSPLIFDVSVSLRQRDVASEVEGL